VEVVAALVKSLIIPAPPALGREGCELRSRCRLIFRGELRQVSGFILPRQGEVGHGGGPAGDLYLEFTVRGDAIFSRSGDDIIATVEIDMIDAIEGNTVTVEALDGEVSLTIKPGAQSADVITVKNRGVTKLRGNGRGDLRFGVHVVTPTKLSSKESELVAKLRELRKPAAPSLAGAQQGMFHKFRDRLFG